MPGHGRTASNGRWRIHDTARDLVALARALPIDAGALRLVGHSWGARAAAAFPAVGLAPARVVVIEPPVVSVEVMAEMTHDPIEHFYESYDEALAAIGGANPTWAYGDVASKAEALTQFDEQAAADVLLANGDWDGGLADLLDERAAAVDRWLIRGDPAAGGMVDDDAAARFSAALGDDHVITIARAPHSPHRTHPVETVAAILRALGVLPVPEHLSRSVHRGSQRGDAGR